MQHDLRVQKYLWSPVISRPSTGRLKFAQTPTIGYVMMCTYRTVGLPRRAGSATNARETKRNLVRIREGFLEGIPAVIHGDISADLLEYFHAVEFEQQQCVTYIDRGCLHNNNMSCNSIHFFSYKNMKNKSYKTYCIDVICTWSLSTAFSKTNFSFFESN